MDTGHPTRPRSAQAREAQRLRDERAHRDPKRRERRRLLAGTGLAMLGGTAAWAELGPMLGPLGSWTQQARAGALAGDSHRFSVTVDADRPGTPWNAGLLGHNIQWVDRGDDLLGPDGQMQPRMLAQVQALGPTVLRFPGGAQSDRYHWERGVGPMAQRRSNEHFHNRQQQPSIMGTAEFLDLCLQTGAQPLITINVPSGSADEAARWVRAVNRDGLRSPRTGARLPRVQHWEIGNEPYLKDEAQPTLTLEPEAFAERADACIRAMRAVDPTLRIGLPLSVNARNGVPVVHFKNYSQRVLARLREPVDYACVHNAYLPFAYDRLNDPDAVYWATMAGARTVHADLDALHQLIRQARPGLRLPVALTEYHAIFSLGRGATDNWTGSPAAALYIADLLRTLALRDDVLWANLWSLSGNWRFGAIHSEGWLRPVGQVLAMLRPLLRGRRLDSRCTVSQIDTPAAGVVAAVAGLPLIETLASLRGDANGQHLQVLLINKDPQREGQGVVDLAGLSVPPQSATLTSLGAPDALRSDDAPDLFTRQQHKLASNPDSPQLYALNLPPASVSLLEVSLSAQQPARGSTPTGIDRSRQARQA